MKFLSFNTGRIEVGEGKCFVEDNQVECLKNGNQKDISSATYKLDLLPPNQSLEIRNDMIYSLILSFVVLIFILISVFRVKIFTKTIGEYLKPIWYFILICLLAVAWQYLFGVKMTDNYWQLMISQWVWEFSVMASAYKLSKLPGFSYANMFFLGVLYSLIIHGTKITIRYFFFHSTFWYMIDRFLYGSLLVMIFSFVLGSIFVFYSKKKT